LGNDRIVDQGLGRVDAHAVEPLAQGAGDLERRIHAVVLEIDEGNEPDAGIHVPGELAGGEHGVAAVCGDEGVRHGADTFGAPPRSEEHTSELQSLAYLV